MKLLFSYLSKYKSTMVLALLLAAINQCFSLMDPYIGGLMLNKFAVESSQFKGDSQRFIQEIILFLLASMGVAMVSRIAKNFQDYFTNVIIQKTGADIYSDGIQHSLGLPYQDFEDQRSGETLGKIQKVRSDAEKFITAFVSILFQSMVGLIFVIWYALKVNWMIAPLFLLTVPLLGMVSSYLSRKIKSLSKKILQETTGLSGSTTESLRNIELVKSLGLTNQEILRLNTVTQKILGLELKKVRYVRSLSFVQGTLVNFMRTCLVFVLYYLVFRDEITPGELMTLMFYSFFVFGPLQELGNVISIYRETQASLNNFSEMMQKPVEKKPEQPKLMGALQKIQFNQVSFQHASSKYPAVENINFTIEKGETIAFVGPSGAGKSTLVKLLVGLYQPVQGEIFYNQYKGQEILFDELRNQTGFVTQDTQLFSGTIRDNLLFVNPHASDQDCLAALEKAACHSLLNRAENGIHTLIGEGGIKISGGEKQRLSIARALLRQPRLLVFDEATSALDSLTEEEIGKTIQSLSGNKDHITVLIAHRLSTILHADRIFVLEQGKIIEQGQHEELLHLKGLYYAMWRQQIGERRIEA